MLHHSNTPLLQSVDLVPEVGIAPTSQRLQRCANLPQLLGAEEWSNGVLEKWRNEDDLARHFRNTPSIHHSIRSWSSRAVTLRGLPVISRALCYLIYRTDGDWLNPEMPLAALSGNASRCSSTRDARRQPDGAVVRVTD